MKTAVVLFNLGGPLQEKDIKPFLFNFFMDKNIIGAPLPVRYLIAKYISITRSKGVAKTGYAKLGYKSPLLKNTQAQAQQLEETLNKKYPDVADIFRVFVSMRYWEPTAQDTVQALDEFAPDRLVLLPLYPEYSTTTTNSSFENFWSVAQSTGSNLYAVCNKGLKVETVHCYPLMKGFVEASAELVEAELEKAPSGTRVLFSAHGLPKKVIAGGDPYQYHCEQAATAIAAKAGLDQDCWRICYQSRIGPLEWIGPPIRAELERAAQDKVGIVVYPHAFVSEHIETLVELDIDYKKEALDLGVPYYARVPTVSTHPDFIAGLVGLVSDALEGRKQPQLCGTNFKRCGCAKKETA